jgi:hypothetical protein
MLFVNGQTILAIFGFAARQMGGKWRGLWPHSVRHILTDINFMLRRTKGGIRRHFAVLSLGRLAL